MKTKATFDTTLLMVRIILGVVIAGHGAQKLLGWFGGFGFDASIGFFTGVIGLPYFLAVLVIIAESFGMIALVVGLMSRYLAASVILIMIGAIVTTHGQFGFFMNWTGSQGGEGFEFHLLVMALALVIVLNGSGSFSIDAYIRARLEERKILTRLLFN